MYQFSSSTVQSLCLSQGITTFTPSPPSPPPPPHEPSHPIHFTSAQLSSLHHHLLSAAPSGFILASSLIDTLCALSNRTVSFLIQTS